MHARIAEVQLAADKWKPFVKAVESIVPMLRTQEGFRTLLVMRPAKPIRKEAKALVITVWDTLADLRASEKSLMFYQALSRVIPHSKGFPDIHQYEVLLSEYAAD